MVHRKLPQRLRSDRARVVRAAIMDRRLSVRRAALGLGREDPVVHALNGLARAIDALGVYLAGLSREGELMDHAMAGERATSGGNRPNVIDRPGLLLGDLRACREALIAAQAEVAVMGATYEALQVTLASIAAAATLLTGERDYFSGAGAGATDGDRAGEARKRALERGE